MYYRRLESCWDIQCCCISRSISKTFNLQIQEQYQSKKVRTAKFFMEHFISKGMDGKVYGTTGGYVPKYINVLLWSSRPSVFVWTALLWLLLLYKLHLLFRVVNYAMWQSKFVRQTRWLPISTKCWFTPGQFSHLLANLRISWPILGTCKHFVLAG